MDGVPLSSPWRRLPIEVRIVLAAIGFRLVGAVVGFLANVTIPDDQDQGFTVFANPNPFWDRFARYDSGWYYGIAAGGYTFVEGGRNNLAFFPLYPLLMGVGGRLLGAGISSEVENELYDVRLGQDHAMRPTVGTRAVRVGLLRKTDGKFERAPHLNYLPAK